MSTRLFVLVLAFLLAGGATAQGKKHIDKAADLPRFSYKLDGKIEDMVRDDAKFKPFAREVRRDLESVLAQYDIEDKATLRQILGELAQLDMLDGDYEAALARVAQVKALEDKPADKLLSGITTRAIVAGVHASADRTSAAYRAAVAQSIKGELAPIPYDVVANEAKEIKAGTELLGEGRLIGNVREVLQPAVDKNGSLSSDLAPALVRTKYAYNYILPLKPTLVDAWTTYLAAHKVDKPDIWAAGAVTLPASGQYAPVKIAIWDSGVDTKLFPDQSGDCKRQRARHRVRSLRGTRDRRAASHSRRAEEQSAAAQVVPQGLLRPSVEHRQPRGERGQEPHVGAQAGRVQGVRRGNRPGRELDARDARRRHRGRRQSLCAPRRGPHRIRLASDP